MKLLSMLTALALFTTRLSAQESSVDRILASLQANVAEYVHALPNFYCDEHVLSTLAPHDTNFIASHTTVDAVFRVRRPPEAKTLNDLKESRDPRLVDGQPLVDEFGFPNAVQLPTLILGVFASAPALFAPVLAACLDFRLAADEPDAMHRIVLEFSTKAVANLPPGCTASLSTSGRAVVDAETLRLLRLEKRTPNYPVYPKLHGTWTWAVDYGPADLGGRTFWLPTRIASDAVADRSHAEWTFDATYSNYHRLTVTSHILPAPVPAAKP